MAKGTKKRHNGAAMEPVGIGAPLRKAFTWLEVAGQHAAAEAIAKRRQDVRGNGPQLSASELLALAMELEVIQRFALNPMLSRVEEIKAQLLAHWGHTGIHEIESPFGNTLISTSVQLSADAELIQRSLSADEWMAVTARTIVGKLLAEAGDKKSAVRDAIGKALKIKNLRVAITPPSSRRPKSGHGDDREDAESEEE